MKARQKWDLLVLNLLNKCKIHPDDHDGIPQVKTFLGIILISKISTSSKCFAQRETCSRIRGPFQY
jgi:hypothetical protein